MNENDVKNQWHQGFYGAMGLELRADAENLIFETERYLSKEPLRMDLLVIKKYHDFPIANEIGHIFRKHNVIEYKSPNDGLSIDDYVKTVGYACLYKSLAATVDEIPVEDITITLVRDRYPRELMKKLKSLGNEIIEKAPGIYYVSGNTMFVTQIIVTSRIADEHMWLRVLTDRIKKRDVINFAREGNKLTSQGEKYNVDAVYQVSVMANEEFYEQIKRSDENMCEALLKLMKPEIDEAFVQGKLISLLDLVKDGLLSIDIAADRAGMTVSEFEKAMENNI